MITLYQFENSPFCDKVRRALHVKGLPYKVREVPTTRSLFAVRKLNPIGKLPCLEHAGQRISDSTNIVCYLEKTFAGPKLVPADPRERALCHVLEDWADESLYFYEVTLRFLLPHNARRFVPLLTRHDPSWARGMAGTIAQRVLRRSARAQGVGRKPIALIEGDLARHLEALAGLLEGRTWLIGEQLTIADIAVFVQLSCIIATGEGARALLAQPQVASWVERVEHATAPAARAAAE